MTKQNKKNIKNSKKIVKNDFLKDLQKKRHPLFGNHRSNSMKATKRIFKVNKIVKKVYDPSQKKYIKICTTRKQYKIFQKKYLFPMFSKLDI